MPSTTVPTANVPNYFSTSYKRFPICGFVYLLPTHHSPFLSGVGELSIGIIITEDEREKGLAKDALDQVLQIAFDKIQCQRVQAQIIDGPMKGSVLKLFTKLRFGHEGTRRRSFFSPFMQEWKDTTCLAMLATDWVIRCSLQPAPPSLWDEMFLRHDRERDALLRWDQGVIDEQRRLLHRTTSMETIRDLRGYQCESQEEDSDAQSVLSMAKGKEKGLAAADNQSAVFVDEASDPEYQLMESDDEGWSSDASGGANSPPLSVSSSSSSGGSFASEDVSDVLDHLTPRSDGYVSSSDGSQWDMLETSSSSSFDSLSESDYRGR
ncbi:hypothetical protein BDZ89DRAFT_951252 [Hymenopellis radicata]|nr:hypothetical protein BDZ89DRAFT_951252 [Hymenopellis radicata]